MISTPVILLKRSKQGGRETNAWYVRTNSEAQRHSSPSISWWNKNKCNLRQERKVNSFESCASGVNTVKSLVFSLKKYIPEIKSSSPRTGNFKRVMSLFNSHWPTGEPGSTIKITYLPDSICYGPLLIWEATAPLASTIEKVKISPSPLPKTDHLPPVSHCVGTY